MLKRVFICLAMSATNNLLAGTTEDVFECQGYYWKYVYRFRNSNKETCEYADEQTKAFPGHPIQNRGRLNFEKMDLLECWRSMARIQVAKVKCCIRSKDGIYSAVDVRACN